MSDQQPSDPSEPSFVHLFEPKPAAHLLKKKHSAVENEQQPAPPSLNATAWDLPNPTSIPPRAWLYGHHIIRGFVTGTIAPGGTGKTSLVVAEMLEMASGKSLVSRHAAPKLRVWYLNLEDPKDELDRRFAAACLAHKLGQQDIGHGLYVDSGIGLKPKFLLASVTRRGAVGFDDALFAALTATIEQFKIDVLVIDPLKRSHNFPENDNTAMDMLVDRLAAVAQQGNCAVMLIHHTRKTGGFEVTAETSRGGQSLVDGLRAVRVLNVMTADEAVRAKVKEADRRLHFRTYLDKLNMAPPPQASRWYKLTSIYLGNGANGGLGDSVGVAMPWDWPDALSGLTSAHLLAVQRYMADNGRWRYDTRSADWVGNAVAHVLQLDAEQDKGRIMEMLRKWFESGALLVSVERDESRKDRKFVKVGTYAT